LKKKIRVGIVGLGFGLQHIRGFQDCENVEVVAVCDVVGKKVEQIARRFDIPCVFTNYRDMLKASELDAVSVATPVYLHHSMTLEALDAGKHVLCEKPLALNVQQGKRMYERAQETGLKHMTNFCWRFSPRLFHMKELVDSGYVGPLYHIEARWIEGSGADPGLPLYWRHKKAEGGFGALGDLGVHIIEMVRWIAGDFSRVCAKTTTLIDRRQDPTSGRVLPTELEDSCMFIAELERNIPALIHVSRCALFNSYISLEIYGRDGVLIYQMPQPSVDIPVPRQKTSLVGARKEDDKIEEIPTPEKLQKIPSSYERFIEGIRSNQPIHPSFLEGLKVQEVADAVVISASERRWVPIE